ncbi:putative integral membrane protein [Eutypa lata UCREL1]|uniref:Putative integral membrane protein n=1 Tax=Eutypa lata (strain UCR-EL1) TaxID=1287681 RepID=M7T2B6_EUTLA|nr:putative integral membrane protein [Eutypa lata UCREL1]
MISSNIGFDVNSGGTKLFIVQLVFLLVAWIISLLRVYVKLFMIRKVSPDDYWMLTALLFYTGYGAIVLHGIALGGTGKHTKELTLDGAEISLRAWYLCEVLYAPMSACIRTSIAVFLLRLSVKTWHRWTIYVVLVITWLVSVGFFVPMVIQCFPPSYFWKQVKGAEGTCMNPVVVPLTAVVHGVISSICDWILGLFPIVLLWNVQINRCTKFGIAALLSMGIIAGIALIARIPFIKTLAISVDFLYETVNVAMWSVPEPGLGIIAGNIATLRPLAKSLGFEMVEAEVETYDGRETK